MSLHISSNCGLSSSLHPRGPTQGSKPDIIAEQRTFRGGPCRSNPQVSFSRQIPAPPLHRIQRSITRCSLQPIVDEPEVKPEEVKPEEVKPPSSPRPPSFRHNLPSGKRLEVIVRRGSGSEELPALVFLHGSFHGAWCWEKWMPYLSERGHDCYAVSFLGQSHAESIAHLIRIIFRRPPVLIGHSFGGLVIQSLLARPADGIVPIERLQFSFVCLNAFPSVQSAGPTTPSRPPLSAAVLLCSVPPSGNRGVFLKRGIQTKPIESMKISFGLAAELFKRWTWLCRETFFSPDMPIEEVERYQKLISFSSKVPLFSLRALKGVLPVEKPSPDHPPVVVMGAANDAVVDEDALQETADFYHTVPLVVPGVAHDLMIDVNWEVGAAAVAELVASLPKI